MPSGRLGVQNIDYCEALSQLYLTACTKTIWSTMNTLKGISSDARPVFGRTTKQQAHTVLGNKRMSNQLESFF